MHHRSKAVMTVPIYARAKYAISGEPLHRLAQQLLTHRVDFMAPSREMLALRQQFEVQSQNFAAVLTELQQLTLELEDQKASIQQQIDEATAASEAKAADMEQRAEEMEARTIKAEADVMAKEEQRNVEVAEVEEILAQVQEQWEMKKQEFMVLAVQAQRPSGGSNGNSVPKADVDSGDRAVASAGSTANTVALELEVAKLRDELAAAQALAAAPPPPSDDSMAATTALRGELEAARAAAAKQASDAAEREGQLQSDLDAATASRQMASAAVDEADAKLAEAAAAHAATLDAERTRIAAEAERATRAAVEAVRAEAQTALDASRRETERAQTEANAAAARAAAAASASASATTDAQVNAAAHAAMVAEIGAAKEAEGAKQRADLEDQLRVEHEAALATLRARHTEELAEANAIAEAKAGEAPEGASSSVSAEMANGETQPAATAKAAAEAQAAATAKVAAEAEATLAKCREQHVVEVAAARDAAYQEARREATSELEAARSALAAAEERASAAASSAASGVADAVAAAVAKSVEANREVAAQLLADREATAQRQDLVVATAHQQTSDAKMQVEALLVQLTHANERASRLAAAADVATEKMEKIQHALDLERQQQGAARDATVETGTAETAAMLQNLTSAAEVAAREVAAARESASADASRRAAAETAAAAAAAEVDELRQLSADLRARLRNQSVEPRTEVADDPVGASGSVVDLVTVAKWSANTTQRISRHRAFTTWASRCANHKNLRHCFRMSRLSLQNWRQLRTRVLFTWTFHARLLKHGRQLRCRAVEVWRKTRVSEAWRALQQCSRARATARQHEVAATVLACARALRRTAEIQHVQQIATIRRQCAEQAKVLDDAARLRQQQARVASEGSRDQQHVATLSASPERAAASACPASSTPPNAFSLTPALLIESPTSLPCAGGSSRLGLSSTTTPNAALCSQPSTCEFEALTTSISRPAARSTSPAGGTVAEQATSGPDHLVTPAVLQRPRSAATHLTARATHMPSFELSVAQVMLKGGLEAQQQIYRGTLQQSLLKRADGIEEDTNDRAMTPTLRSLTPSVTLRVALLSWRERGLLQCLQAQRLRIVVNQMRASAQYVNVSRMLLSWRTASSRERQLRLVAISHESSNLKWREQAGAAWHAWCGMLRTTHELEQTIAPRVRNPQLHLAMSRWQGGYAASRSAMSTQLRTLSGRLLKLKSTRRAEIRTLTVEMAKEDAQVACRQVLLDNVAANHLLEREEAAAEAARLRDKLELSSCSLHDAHEEQERQAEASSATEAWLTSKLLSTTQERDSALEAAHESATSHGAAQLAQLDAEASKQCLIEQLRCADEGIEALYTRRSRTPSPRLGSEDSGSVATLDDAAHDAARSASSAALSEGSEQEIRPTRERSTPGSGDQAPAREQPLNPHSFTAAARAPSPAAAELQMLLQPLPRRSNAPQQATDHGPADVHPSRRLRRAATSGLELGAAAASQSAVPTVRINPTDVSARLFKPTASSVAKTTAPERRKALLSVLVAARAGSARLQSPEPGQGPGELGVADHGSSRGPSPTSTVGKAPQRRWQAAGRKVVIREADEHHDPHPVGGSTVVAGARGEAPESNGGASPSGSAAVE